MYVGFNRFRAGAIALLALPIVAVVVVVFVMSSSSPTSSPPNTGVTTLPSNATTAPHTTTTSHSGTQPGGHGYHVTTPSTVPPSSLNLADRKAAELAGEAYMMTRGSSLFSTRFLMLSSRGAAPHYTIIAPLGNYFNQPSLLKVGVVGSKQVICLSMPPVAPAIIPATVVACP